MTFALPSVRVPVLSITSVSTLFQALQRLGVFDQDARLRAAADPTMIDIGVASPSAHGQAMMRTLTAARRPSVKRGSGPKIDQAAKAASATAITTRHEPGRHLVGKPGDRRARALCRGNRLHDARKHGVAADFFGAHDEAAALIDRTGRHPRARFLADGHGFAGEHGFVDRRAAVDDAAVHRDFFAGPHAQPVADGDRFERHILVAAVPAHAPRATAAQARISARMAADVEARARNSNTCPISTRR